MKHLRDTIAGLRLGFEEHFRSAGSISLFVGLSCNLAFVGQVYFWPAMWHTSAFMFSYTDASYVAEVLCALMLGRRLRQSGRLAVGSRWLWALALLVQASLALYCVLFGAGIHVPEPVNWVCGAIFGVYLPVAMTSWFAVHIDRRSFSVIWNIVLAGVFASFVIWVFSGLEAVKLCVCMGVLMFVGTFVLSRKLRTEQAKERDDAAAPAAAPADAFRYPASATFLFSFSFITAIAFAGIGGDSASYASGDFFAPMLLICAVVLLANAAVLPLTTIAVPAIIVAVIAASYLHLEPALSFDLAALGMFLFLAYAVVLLCASAQGSRRRTLAAFTSLMVAFAAGCLVGRLCMALCFAFAEQFASNIMVLLSILAANAAMIILVRRGVTPTRSAELFEGEQATGDLDAARRAKVDRVAAACGLGEREKEVLTLLLEGCSASEVASAMVVANGTAKSHIRHVYKKLGVHSRDELFEKLGIEREEKSKQSV
ncbi:response regulator transcription factor [Adlercreutzia sp.]|uniref:response regulator transcription factor n=1 Tax=Adlercreutzia sp. TaxID=1872387 RepID=UPI003AEFCB1F